MSIFIGMVLAKDKILSNGARVDLCKFFLARFLQGMNLGLCEQLLAWFLQAIPRGSEL